MKIGFTSLTLRNEDIYSVVEYARKAELSGIEWGVSDGHVILGDFDRAKEIGRITRENSMEVFSLGSYCRMMDEEECIAAVETAAALGAPVIRVWAGNQSPQDCDDAYFETIVEKTRFMAGIAKKHGISIGFEFHHNTLTETAESAVKLIKAINCENAGLYWQPDYNLTPEENVKERDIVLPYCVGNMHVQNYSVQTGYGLLSEINTSLEKFYGDIKDKPFNLMIEFVKDAAPENVIRDAEALRKILYI